MNPVKPGSKVSQETRDKISAKLKGKKRDPEIGRKISAAKKGVPRPRAAALALAKFNTGKKRTPETKEALRQGALRMHARLRARAVAAALAALANTTSTVV